jgi:hypothetical protein
MNGSVVRNEQDNDDLEPAFLLAKALACVAGAGVGELRSRSLLTSHEDAVTLIFKGVPGVEIRTPSYVWAYLKKGISDDVRSPLACVRTRAWCIACVVHASMMHRCIAARCTYPAERASPLQVSNDVRRMSLTKDATAAIFDVPKDKVKIFLALAAEWKHGETIETARELPELQERRCVRE